ncbi:MAG: cell division protein ZipA [Gammaproteobacteria bacterium]|nr:cell division protein ZipA [Gammaproteobacteria bacterium]
MSTMQIVFSIIGLVLIAAIIGHGVWTIRRNEKAQQQRAEMIEQKRRQVDSQGFDDDGVGAVRVVKTTARKAAEVAPEPRLESLDDELETSEEVSTHSTAQPAPAIRASDEEPDLDLPQVKVEQEDLQQRAQAKPQPENVEKAAAKKAAAEKLAANKAAQPAQQSMDLPLERSEDEPVINEEPDEVIVLHVSGDIQGAVLLQQMTELGFKFGDFDIFHRHVDTAGNGAVLFSLANMYNPGSFNIDTIETFQTDGVALFLALPIKSNSLQAFTMMHNAAVKLAAAVGRGQVLDEHRNPLTRQAVQHIHQRIREFERKRLIKHSN